MVQLLGFFSVSPAPAGMIPFEQAMSKVKASEPRTRGDDPPSSQLRTLRQM